jgi:predicted enzyme related to lactoylglutathione lyase
MSQAKIVWFEINADDPAKVAKFYKDAFGWEIEQWQGHDYWLIKTGITPEHKGFGIDGAVGKHTIDQKVVNIVGVEDIDAAVEKAKKAGAKLFKAKEKIPQVGYLVYMKDPEGIVFGILQPKMD